MEINTWTIFLTMFVSFALTAVIGHFVLKWLVKNNMGQQVREEGPESHKSKSGTPTMGGIMFIAGSVITCVLMRLGISADMAVLLISFLLFAGIGLVDDYLKITRGKNEGLTAKQKFLFQLVIAIILAIYQAKMSEFGTSIYVPIAKVYFDLGWLYFPFVVFVLVAMVNAVNLTDGMDGLAAGCTFFVALFLTSQSLIFGNADTTVFCAALTGGCIGFLLYNRHPAKVFMGDTGSLALGGALAAAAIMMHIELILVIAGGVFVAECLSVIIQVIYFRKTGGKRIFKMTPLHHHFQDNGKNYESLIQGHYWKETSVTLMFWGITFALCILSMFLM